VDNKTAWEQVQKNLNVAMNSEFYAEGDFITGTVGDNNIVGQLSNLPMANVNFSAIDGSHEKTIETPVGSKLKLSKKDFPADEYAITITFETKDGVKQTYAWMNTSGDVVKETRELIFKELPAAPKSPMANYYNDFVKTVQWLDKANKLWEHPYGYRRYFDGVKNARRGLAKLQNSMNPFNAVFPSPRTTKFQTGECKITADWKILDTNKTDDYLTQKIRDFWLETFKTSIQYSGKTGESKTINLKLKPLAKNNESYFIKIDDKNITIEAQSRKGLFYGVSSLIQALKQSTTLPVGTITDQPAYPLRSVMVSSQVKVGMNDEFKAYIRKLANLRYNEAYLYSPSYLHLDDEAQLEEIKAVHAFCKAHFIEPVPFFETFGSATLTRVINPELAEGVFHENEIQTVSSTGEINLDVPRIHDHKYSTVHILYNGRELSRDKDFKIISTEKPEIKILDKNLFGKEVSLSYDAVDFSSFPHPASCPSDPRGWELQEKVILSVIKELNPPKLHISQDEAGFVNTCSQCKARGLT
ncbi:MAG: glycoside hydrolase family 20 zincin-like fold domain-containing protein, partial [Bacteroidota bacterium]